MNRKFKRVAVLMGGPSSEREVSLRSGAAISAGLKAKGYDVVDLDLQGADVKIPAGVEAVFIALHGTFGEDGGVQAALRELGLPFTGSGVEASRLAFDKVASKKVMEQHGLPTPRYEVLRKGQPRTLPLPVVVKPPREGSSVGVSRVFDEAEWAGAVERSHAIDPEILVESFIEGRELTVGIVGDQVLPIVEILAPGGSYDYHAKYTKGVTEYVVPAPVPEAVTRRCQDIAWGVFQALGCSGMSRVDIRLTPDDEPFVLEINTIPGCTETSLLPKAARCAGIEFPDLCEMILNRAGLGGAI